MWYIAGIQDNVTFVLDTQLEHCHGPVALRNKKSKNYAGVLVCYKVCNWENIRHKRYFQPLRIRLQ